MIQPPVRLAADDDGLDHEVAGWIEIRVDGFRIDYEIQSYDCREGRVMAWLCGCCPPTELTGQVEARWRAGTPPHPDSRP